MQLLDKLKNIKLDFSIPKCNLFTRVEFHISEASTLVVQAFYQSYVHYITHLRGRRLGDKTSFQRFKIY